MRDFILGYFGKKYKTAQSRYHDFVTRLVGQENNNPLDEVTGSVLLGGQDFVNFIKGRYLTVVKKSKDVPAVSALAINVSIQDISNIVDQAMGDETKKARKIKIFLCHKYTGQQLRTIGEAFGIGDLAVSKLCKRFRYKIDRDMETPL